MSFNTQKNIFIITFFHKRIRRYSCGCHNGVSKFITFVTLKKCSTWPRRHKIRERLMYTYMNEKYVVRDLVVIIL